MNDKGQLVFETRFGEVAMADLEVYQGGDKKRVQAQFVCMAGERWGFSLGKYDKTQDLLIDPLIYSTYIGGSGEDTGYGIAVDGSGFAYVTGWTYSTDYDITPGAFQTTSVGGKYSDVFVTKLNATGTALVYSTYLGGSDYDYGYDIAVDGSGFAYVTGWTTSTDYDITPGAFQTTHGGGFYDVFVTKLNSTGTALVYSTYLGGSGADDGYGIAVDGSGFAYVTGWTSSTDYDITPGAFQTTYGGYDVFVTKLNASGTALVYSTYLGGSDGEGGKDIYVDGSGNAYVTGETYSTNFDVTPGAFQTTFGGGRRDVFVTKLNATGTALVYSTYLGGSNDDSGNDIYVDGSGNAYVTGGTESTNFDVTPGAFQTTHEGYYDVFVTKLNATGSALVYSTYLGGGRGDLGYDIYVDSSGNAYVAGYTSSSDFDVTSGAFQTTHGGSDDVFVTKLNATGTALVYSTYLGGSSGDSGNDIYVDGSGNAYVTGYTESSDFDVTPGAFQTTYGGGGSDDVFVTKLNATGTALVYSTYLGGSDDDYGSGIYVDGSGNAFITGKTESTDFDVSPGAFQTTHEGYEDVFVTKLDLSGTTDVSKPFSELSIRIYPNPASLQFVIESERGGVFELLDVTGKVLERLEVKGGRQTIPVRYPAGLYFIREQASGATQKLVIE